MFTEFIYKSLNETAKSVIANFLKMFNMSIVKFDWV